MAPPSPSQACPPELTTVGLQGVRAKAADFQSLGREKDVSHPHRTNKKANFTKHLLYAWSREVETHCSILA